MSWQVPPLRLLLVFSAPTDSIARRLPPCNPMNASGRFAGSCLGLPGLHAGARDSDVLGRRFTCSRR